MSSKNITVMIAVLLAIIMASFAMAFRPANKTGEWEPMSTSEVRTLPLTTAEPTETRKTEPSRVRTTTEVKTYSETQKRTTETTETTKVNKIVSRLQEQVSKDREWLEKHEGVSKKAKIETTMTPAEFRRAGVVYANGYKYTWYSEKVLPGKGLKIPGRHSDGNFVRDGDGYICVASSDLPKGTVVDTPFGKGKVYDTGCPSGVIDIYVSW